MATASCSYTPNIAISDYPIRPRYLEKTSSSSSISHKRSGTLKTTIEYSMIAQQRSKALHQSVSQGDISLDAILAFPIDWQGIANELQWTRSRMATIQEEDDDPLITMNPLAIKTRSRTVDIKQDRHSIWASASSSYSSPQSQYYSPDSISPLGLDLSGTTMTDSNSSPFTDGDIDTDRSSIPELYFSRSFDSSSSCSSSINDESPLSTPLPLQDDTFNVVDSSFELKKYCSIFNESVTYIPVLQQKVQDGTTPMPSSLSLLPSPILYT